jgi:hypothetical protein
VAPILLRLRSGKTAARVIALGFGGGTMFIGLASLASQIARHAGGLGGVPIAAALRGVLVGYGLAALPFLALAAGVALCRSELWLVPEARAFRLLTYRPWRRGPRVEQASVDEYAGVRIEPAPEQNGGGVLVSLIATDGEAVPLRQFEAEGEARPFAEQLAAATGLWLRSGMPSDAGVAPPS